MKCVERKIRLSGEEVSYECELLLIEKHYGVVRYVIEKDRTVDDLTLPAGTVTLGLYFSDRPYNLYYWIAPPTEASAASDPWSRDIAYYFNIAEPLSLTAETISYRDLVVDVLVLPDGSARVLDEEELPDDLDASLATRIAEARDEVLTKRSLIIAEARERLLPFARAE